MKKIKASITKKWIYLIKAEVDDIKYYKIGITSRLPEKRLKELQTGNAVQLELINMFETNFANLFETTLHRTFSYEKEMGEWFLLNDEQVFNFIAICTKLEENFLFISENNTYSENKKLKRF